MTSRCWFFGCWSADHLGHYLYLPSGIMAHECPAGTAWDLDCRYAPECGQTRRTCTVQTLGIWRRTVVNGWTVIACWDRTSDSRRNSNAAFIVEGERGLKSALTIARQQFPDQIKRILKQFVDPMLQEGAQ